MIRHIAEQTRLRFIVTRGLPAILLTLAVGGLAMLLLSWSAQRSDEVSFERQEELVHVVVSQLRARVAHDQESATVWDKAVTEVRADDTSWMDNNLGTWMHTYFGFDGAYVLNPADRPIYAFANRAIAKPAVYAAIASKVDPLVNELRKKMRGGDINGANPTFLSPGVADLTVIRGHPAVVSVKPIVSDTGKIKQVPGTEYMHVAVRFLDGSFVQKLTNDYLFKGLRFSWSGKHGPAEAAYPLDDTAGKRIGYYVWKPYRPGTAVLSSAVPVLAVVLVLALSTIAGFLAAIRSRSLKLQASEAKMHHLALHDPLTGLPNRAFFNARVDESLSRQSRSPLALLYLDLDRFKQVNDTLGHPAGDTLIKEFGARLKSLVRDNDMVARIGGDEFTVMLQDVIDQADVEPLCARIVDSVRKPFDLEGNRVFVGLSVGVAIAPKDGTDRIELLRKADIALYHAKSAGRGRYAFFDTHMDNAVRLRREIEQDLRTALQTDGEIVPYYQPIYSASGQTVTGFEALLRWQHPLRGFVPPEVFIPIAEDSGLIAAIGERVLWHACEVAARRPNKTVAVNASGVELADPNYAMKVAQVLRSTRLEPERLEIEISETAADSGIGVAADNLQALRDLGVLIAIDDFGTGFSSLARLQQLKVDRVKIDKSFIHRVGRDPDDHAIVQAIVDIAHAKGLRVTGEGVETTEQWHILTQIGCDDLQGFLFSTARPASEIEIMKDAAVDGADAELEGAADHRAAG